MVSIAFLIPWFGPFPAWMRYYLKSCEYNPSIDFYFFTDRDAPVDSPANCYFQKLRFSEYCHLVSDRLDIDFHPSSPYKLCDLKPTYGLVHAELIRDYDFWGFGDIDVIYGDLRSFLPDTLLQEIDLFSTHGTRIAGHFTLLRNNPFWCNIFKNVADYATIFEDTNHSAFDEKAFSRLFMGFKNYPSKVRDFLRFCFMPLSRRVVMVEQYSTPGCRYGWLDGSRNFPTEWYWQQGVLSNNRVSDPFLYLHFLDWKREKYKKDISIDFVDAEQLDKSWKITSKGFENYNGGSF